MEENRMFEESRVLPVNIEHEVQKSFLEYSMSVIVSRALPDVRDGMKPIHRRIMYALYDQGMTHDKPHKKSANIVGEVMGKYHPHGDSAIYQTMVRLAQDFSMRYPLVDGHGNFGSIDGDQPAAMRYTESRMSKISAEMLADIDKETIDWMPNYDGTRQEPTVLPSRLPNLLLNGSSGIAVGMATNMPPHNLNEVAAGVKMLLENPEATVQELMQVIPGPDFPTGGLMMRGEIAKAYETGRGSVKVRARYHLEEKKGGKTSIIFTEIPYMVNKARLIERIADLVKEKRIDGIADLRDESDRNGIRIVIELKKDVNADMMVNRLYKNTQLQDNFGIINLALVKGRPKILSLKQLLEYYIEHRKEIITRRTQHELKLARDREHILEGLKIALDNLDEVVRIIRTSKDREMARNGLITNFGLSEVQANAILDMRLVQLTNLEQEKIENELREIRAKIQDLLDILANPQRIVDIIEKDMDEISGKYGDKRRTEIIRNVDEFSEEDFVEDEETVITLSNRGYIKRQPLSAYRAQRRGGKGISAVSKLAENDYTSDVLVTTLLTNLLFFTDQGRAFSLKAYQVPEFSRQAKGQAVINLIALKPDEKVTAMMPVSGFDTKEMLLMVTLKGMTKKVALSNFANIRKNGLIAITLQEDDELIGVIRMDSEKDSVMLVTAHGQGILFEAEQVREMGRVAMGVRAIKLELDDYVIGVDKVFEGAEAVIVTKNGYGKRTDLTLFRTQNRGGKGIKTIDVNSKNGLVVGFRVVQADEDLMIVTSKGIVTRQTVRGISTQKRYSRGVILMNVDKDDYVTAVETFKQEAEEGKEEEAGDILTEK